MQFSIKKYNYQIFFQFRQINFSKIIHLHYCKTHFFIIFLLLEKLKLWKHLLLQKNTIMKTKLLFIAMLWLCYQSKAQDAIMSLNFLQAGAVPGLINEKGGNVSTSGLSFNYVSFTEPSFFRMDATWLVRYLLNGQKDTGVFNDSNKLYGLDLPVFTATYGTNLIKDDDFSLGVGINLDSRTFYSSPDKKAKAIIDAFNVGFCVGAKVRINDYITYFGIGGYDFMFTDAKGKSVDGNQIYLQNNVTFFLGGKIGINLQPDLTIKSFDTQGFKNASLVSKNIKLGITLAID